jgi:hypothetical protein
MKPFMQRRLDLKISVLRGQADKLPHERELLRRDYIYGKAGEDQALAQDLAEQIRVITKKYDVVCRELREVINKRYWKEQVALRRTNDVS